MSVLKSHLLLASKVDTEMIISLNENKYGSITHISHQLYYNMIYADIAKGGAQPKPPLSSIKWANPPVRQSRTPHPSGAHFEGFLRNFHLIHLDLAKFNLGKSANMSHNLPDPT